LIDETASLKTVEKLKSRINNLMGKLSKEQAKLNISADDEGLKKFKDY